MQAKTFANYQLLAIFLIALLPLFVVAQLNVSAEYRPRTELRHGFKTMFNNGDESAFFTSQRTRLNFDFNTKQTKYMLSVQDVRVWGDHFQLSAVSQQIMLHQAWAEYLFNPKLSLKVGRQELIYDDARILGNVDWAQQARAHDLALLKYEGDFKIHVGAAFNQMAENLKNTFYPVTNYKTMQFVWFNKGFSNLNLSLLFLNNGIQHEDNSNPLSGIVRKTVFSQTFGGRATYVKGMLSLATAAYYTRGVDAQSRDLSAYYASVEATYKISKIFNFVAGYELLSGTSDFEKISNPTNYVNRSFNPFYGTNHKFNGHMDYFYVGNYLNKNGLNDIYGTLNYKKDKISLGCTLHSFAAANKVRATNGDEMKPWLGFEADVFAALDLNEQVRLSVGYSQMFGSETLEQVSGGSMKTNNYWAFAMMTFKPKFLTK
jgi:hypothetical protein